MIQRNIMALFGISGLLLLCACGQETSAATEDTTVDTTVADETVPATDPSPMTEDPTTEDSTTEAPTTEAPDPALAAVEAGRAFYEEQGCANCHVEGVDDVMAPPGLRAVDAGSLLAFMDGTAPHSGGVSEDVTEEDAANLEAYLATL